MTPSKESFPTLHLEWGGDYGLPDSGELTVKFRKVSETNSKHGGETRQSVILDIVSIERVKKGPGPETKSEDEDYDEEESSADRLDKMAEEADDEGED